MGATVAGSAVCVGEAGRAVFVAVDVAVLVLVFVGAAVLVAVSVGTAVAVPVAVRVGLSAGAVVASATDCAVGDSEVAGGIIGVAEAQAESDSASANNRIERTMIPRFPFTNKNYKCQAEPCAG